MTAAECELIPGDQLRATLNVEVDGTPTNADTIQAEVLHPDEITIDTYTLADSEFTQGGTGEYILRVPVDEAGRWWVRFELTGTVVGAEEASIRVGESAFP